MNTASEHTEVREAPDQATLEVIFAIRRAVFVEEQAVNPEEEYDEYEAVSRHFLLEVGGQPVATGRFRHTDHGWKIERMAVLREARGKGYGATVLRHLLTVVPEDGHPIYLHAQEHALSFYQRHGFVAEGDRFFEANIPHFRMVYRAG